MYAAKCTKKKREAFPYTLPWIKLASMRCFTYDSAGYAQQQESI